MMPTISEPKTDQTKARELAERFKHYGDNAYRPAVFGADDKAQGPMMTQADCFIIAAALRAYPTPAEDARKALEEIANHPAYGVGWAIWNVQQIARAALSRTPSAPAAHINRPFAFAVRRAPENGPDAWRLFMDEGEAREAADQLDGDYIGLYRVEDRPAAIPAMPTANLAPRASETRGSVVTEPRFFIDHGMIHDRETGKHVTTEPDTAFCDGIERCCELLNALAERREPRAFPLLFDNNWLEDKIKSDPDLDCETGVSVGLMNK